MRAKDRPLANDFVSDAEFDKFLHAWFGNMARVLEPGRCFFIWGGYANCANYPPVLKAKDVPVQTAGDPFVPGVDLRDAEQLALLASLQPFAAELERDLKLGLPLEAKARHVFVAGDIAQIVLDWSIDGTGPDGKHVHVGGSAADILRRGADGLWRYIIDNNQGTAVREPA